jgi:hypothetical protein
MTSDRLAHAIALSLYILLGAVSGAGIAELGWRLLS